jgi:hypothetical protein
VIALLIPTFSDLAGWGGTAFAALVFIGLGRLASQGKSPPEVALAAGWGAMALALTLWGVTTPASLRYPAWVLAIAGLAGLIAPRSRLKPGEWRGMLRIAILALPLLAVMASARPSLPDTYLNLLPDAAYVADHGFFPADGRPDAHSFLPAAPYNQQLAAFVASLVTPGFPANGLIGFNLVLQLAAGLLLARLAAKSEDDPGKVPSWGAAALGLLLATALNPGFVPRYDLSSYGENAIAAALACAGFAACRRGGKESGVTLALILAGLASIKPDSIALALGVAAIAMLLPPLTGETKRQARTRIGLCALPALILYAAWHWYVSAHFASPGAELTLLPPGQWHVAALPGILFSMLAAMPPHAIFFAALFAVTGIFLFRLRGDGVTSPEMRAAAMLSGVTGIYVLALVFAYVAHDFPSANGGAADAHSFFRYATHLSLLLMMAITWLARKRVGAWMAALPTGRRRFLPGAAIPILCVFPLAFLHFLRFDLEAPQQRAWILAKEVAARVSPGGHLLLLLPGDNDSLSTALAAILRLTPPRREDLQIDDITGGFTPHELDAIPGGTPGEQNEWALLSCAPDGVDGVQEGQAALFLHDVTGWRVTATLSYPPPGWGRWSRNLAAPPLCLGG